MSQENELRKEAEIRRKNLINSRNQVYLKCLNKYCSFIRKSNYPVIYHGAVIKVDIKSEILEIQEERTVYNTYQGLVDYEVVRLDEVISVPFSDIYGDCTIYDIGISAGDIGPINKKAIRDEICAMKQKRLDENKDLVK